MPSLPENILTNLTNIPQDERLARAYLQPVDMAPGERAPWNQSGAENGDNIAFQYWPETLQDSRSSEWSPRSIPGGSHPLYQWTNGGERRLSFTGVFTTDTAPEEGTFEWIEGIEGLPSATTDPYELQSRNVQHGLEIGTRDIDLRAVVSWLRWYTYPYYDDQSWKAFEPPKSLLVMPNSGIGYAGSHHVLAVMTQCDVTYEEFFSSGFPRLIEVSLEFAESVQQGNRVRFHDRRLIGQSGFARNVGRYLSTRANERSRSRR